MILRSESYATLSSHKQLLFGVDWAPMLPGDNYAEAEAAELDPKSAASLFRGEDRSVFVVGSGGVRPSEDGSKWKGAAAALTLLQRQLHRRGLW